MQSRLLLTRRSIVFNGLILAERMKLNNWAARGGKLGYGGRPPVIP